MHAHLGARRGCAALARAGARGLHAYTPTRAQRRAQGYTPVPSARAGSKRVLLEAHFFVLGPSLFFGGHRSDFPIVVQN